MKPFSFIQLTTGVLAIVAMAITGDLKAANAGAKEQMGKATVQNIKGSATYSENGKMRGLLKTGMVLGEGASITTTPGSQVQLWLGDNGQLLQVLENTTVGINTLRLQKTPADVIAHTELELKKGGGLIGNVKKLANASKFDVKYAEGVAGIRGTEWAILPNGRVVCTQGSVTVTFIINGVSKQVTITAGQTVNPPTTPGGEPSVGPSTKGDIQMVNNAESVNRDGLTRTIRDGRSETIINVSSNTGQRGDSDGDTLD